jgi:hypothetical protein
MKKGARGEIGRRKGLKIPRGATPHVGSSPTGRTNKFEPNIQNIHVRTKEGK